VLPPRLSSSLYLSQLVAFLTLIRSVAYDRWITVLGSVLLIIGATAALRHRTWGIGLMLASAVAFPVAWAIGIAPPWFCLVGLAGALPFVHSWRAMVRFDRGAAMLYAALATIGGTATALLWKTYAYSVFDAIPALTPTDEAGHLGLLGATAAMAAIAIASGLRVGGCTQVRARVAATSEPAFRVSADEIEEEEEAVTSSRRSL
jgi:hypothetical protein